MEIKQFNRTIVFFNFIIVGFKVNGGIYDFKVSGRLSRISFCKNGIGIDVIRHNVSDVDIYQIYIV